MRAAASGYFLAFSFPCGMMLSISLGIRTAIIFTILSYRGVLFMDISKLLTFTAKEGASDCHISAGEPPMIRMNGDLKKLDHPALTTEETHALIYDMMSDTQRKNFEEKRECDSS